MSRSGASTLIRRTTCETHVLPRVRSCVKETEGPYFATRRWGVDVKMSLPSLPEAASVLSAPGLPHMAQGIVDTSVRLQEGVSPVSSISLAQPRHLDKSSENKRLVRSLDRTVAFRARQESKTPTDFRTQGMAIGGSRRVAAELKDYCRRLDLVAWIRLCWSMPLVHRLPLGWVAARRLHRCGTHLATFTGFRLVGVPPQSRALSHEKRDTAVIAR